VKPASHPILPARKEFLALAKEHTLVPVCRTLTADLETPVSAFLRAAWPEREAFLLESVEGGEQVGRYTFIGIEPFKRIVAKASAQPRPRGTSSRYYGRRWADTSRRDLRDCRHSLPARLASSLMTRCARLSACPS
jgi:anthranilate synthase component 1